MGPSSNPGGISKGIGNSRIAQLADPVEAVLGLRVLVVDPKRAVDRVERTRKVGNGQRLRSEADALQGPSEGGRADHARKLSAFEDSTKHHHYTASHSGVAGAAARRHAFCSIGNVIRDESINPVESASRRPRETATDHS